MRCSLSLAHETSYLAGRINLSAARRLAHVVLTTRARSHDEQTKQSGTVLYLGFYIPRFGCKLTARQRSYIRLQM